MLLTKMCYFTVCIPNDSFVAQIRKLKTTLILLITSRLRCKSKSKEHGLPAFDSRLFYNKGLLNLTADIKLHWVPQLPKNKLYSNIINTARSLDTWPLGVWTLKIHGFEFEADGSKVVNLGLIK